MKLQLHNAALVSPNGNVCVFSTNRKMGSQMLFTENNLKFDSEQFVPNNDFSKLDNNKFVSETLYSAGRWVVEINE